MSRAIDVREISAEEYSAFLAGTEHSAFQRLEWLAATQAAYRVRVTTLGFFDGERLVAVGPLLQRRMGPFRLSGFPLRKCGIPTAIPFCAPAAAAPEVLAPLLGWARRRHVQYLQITLPHGVEADGVAPFEPFDNLELDIARPIEAVWKSIPDSQRSCIRKAVRLGVRAHWIAGDEALRTLRRMLDWTYNRQGIAPNISDAFYRELHARRHENGLRILCAVHQNRPVAVTWIFRDAGRCYYWDAASDEGARELNANHLLVWLLIRWAHRKRARVLDFVGSGTGRDAGSRPGIGQFKRSMGARPVRYQIRYRYTPLLHAALIGFRLLQRVRAALRRNKGPRNARRN